MVRIYCITTNFFIREFENLDDAYNWLKYWDIPGEIRIYC